MTVTMYGIPNCDTVKKARKWLDDRDIAYHFHDYKKQGAPAPLLRDWSARLGWEALLNRKGTTFRALDETDKSSLDENSAIVLMERHPSLIKRPVIDFGGIVLVGFQPADWARHLEG